MKSFFLALAFIVTVSTINAQYNVESYKYKIAFTTTEKLDKYETEAATVIGYENNDYAVDIEIFPLSQQSSEFIDSQKYGAVYTAEALGLEDAKLGGTVDNIPGAYYAIAYDNYEGERSIVYVIAALNKKLGISYEATIYCYNNNSEEGKRIAKSFRLLD